MDPKVIVDPHKIACAKRMKGAGRYIHVNGDGNCAFYALAVYLSVTITKNQNWTDDGDRVDFVDSVVKWLSNTYKMNIEDYKTFENVRGMTEEQIKDNMDRENNKPIYTDGSRDVSFVHRAKFAKIFQQHVKGRLHTMCCYSEHPNCPEKLKQRRWKKVLQNPMPAKLVRYQIISEALSLQPKAIPENFEAITPRMMRDQPHRMDDRYKKMDEFFLAFLKKIYEDGVYMSRNFIIDIIAKIQRDFNLKQSKMQWKPMQFSYIFAANTDLIKGHRTQPFVIHWTVSTEIESSYMFVHGNNNHWVLIIHKNELLSLGNQYAKFTFVEEDNYLSELWKPPVFENFTTLSPGELPGANVDHTEEDDRELPGEAAGHTGQDDEEAAGDTEDDDDDDQDRKPEQRHRDAEKERESLEGGSSKRPEGGSSKRPEPQNMNLANIITNNFFQKMYL